MTWLDYCLPLVRQCEGCRLRAYPDPATGAEPYTVGYGATGPNIGPDTEWTQAQADTDLVVRLDALNTRITPAIRVRITQQQRAALVSLGYNIGASALIGSTLLRKLNAGDVQGAADQFRAWCKANGQVMPGLVRRRELERELFLS